MLFKPCWGVKPCLPVLDASSGDMKSKTQLPVRTAFGCSFPQPMVVASPGSFSQIAASFGTRLTETLLIQLSPRESLTSGSGSSRKLLRQPPNNSC